MTEEDAVRRLMGSLPTHEESEARMKAGTASPLHKFIYENEPMGVEQETIFRYGLALLMVHFTEFAGTRTVADAARYHYLRARPLDITTPGVFAGKIPDNIVLNGVDLDIEIDHAMVTEDAQKREKSRDH
jgi:hypothetical protein